MKTSFLTEIYAAFRRDFNLKIPVGYSTRPGRPNATRFPVDEKKGGASGKGRKHAPGATEIGGTGV
jgi:hypothetical protein